MAKYISKQAAIYALTNEANTHSNPVKRAYTRAAAIIEQITAEDVQPVKHGRWIKCDYKKLDDAGEVQTYIGQGVYCSKCKTGFQKNEVKNWIGCPCCLTRMDGDPDV